MRTAALLLLLGSFAFAEEENGANETEETAPPPVDLDEILNNPLAESDYREQKTCIRMRTVDDVEVLDESLVLFTGRRGELWLNQLSSQCYGLEADMLLRFRAYAGNYCRLDSFRGVPRFGTFAITADCRLGSFETVDELQVEALRRAVEERQKVGDMAKKTRRQERRRRRAQ